MDQSENVWFWFVYLTDFPHFIAASRLSLSFSLTHLSYAENKLQGKAIIYNNLDSRIYEHINSFTPL